MRSFEELSPQRQAEALRGVEDPALIDDPDNPAWTAEDFRRATYFCPSARIDDITPEMYARMRGRPKSAAPKVATKLRIDPDVLAAFKSDGPGWQTRMNAALRAAMPGAAKRSA